MSLGVRGLNDRERDPRQDKMRRNGVEEVVINGVKLDLETC